MEQKDNFEQRSDIVEYRIVLQNDGDIFNNHEILWKGKSQTEFRKQIKPALLRYIETCKRLKGTGNYLLL